MSSKEEMVVRKCAECGAASAMPVEETLCEECFFEEQEIQYEIQQEHVAGTHRGMFVQGCEICWQEPGVILECNSCHEEVRITTREEWTSMGEDHWLEWECIGCASGLNKVRECEDCMEFLPKEDQFTRWQTMEGDAFVVHDYRIVCLNCYMEDPGSVPDLPF